MTYRRTLIVGAAVGLFGVTGCGASGEKHNEEEWNQLLIDELESLDHVTELTDFQYTMRGVLGAKTTAWISGTVRSNTDDAAINEALRDEVGTIVATIHRNNPVRKSMVRVYVLSPSMLSYEFRDKDNQPISNINELADFYGVER